MRLPEGVKKRIHFAAYWLKYSRWVGVVTVEDERIESLVRALLECFEASGGVPLGVAFDRAKTVVVGQDEHGRPLWNSTLAQVAIDYSFSIGLCAPRSPEQDAMAESCFECVLLDQRSFRTPAEARMELFRYIEGWYNPRRRHSSLGYLSPVKFEAKYWPAAGEELGGQPYLKAYRPGLLAGLGSTPLQAAELLDTQWREEEEDKLIQPQYSAVH